MRIVARAVLREFGKKHADAEQYLDAWWLASKRANWKSPHDVKKQYAAASIVANNRAVFNICGNKYRLVVEFHYNRGYGFVRFIGTHAAYDKIDVEKV